MEIQTLISIRMEARAAVAEELRLELWKLPTKVAERLEAYEARVAVHVAQLSAGAGALPAAAVAAAPAAVAAPAAPSSAEATDDAEDTSDDKAPDLADDLDDGKDLF